MLDYASLAALAAVIREGSFERAAAVLGVTPSAVSQRVKALEERLGTVLVVRGQPCLATATGGRLCAHAERVRLRATYSVFQTDLEGNSKLFAVGDYDDEITFVSGQPFFLKKHVVLDSYCVPNLLAVPL